MSNKVPYD